MSFVLLQRVTRYDESRETSFAEYTKCSAELNVSDSSTYRVSLAFRIRKEIALT